MFLALPLVMTMIALLFILLVHHLTKNRGHLESLGIPMDRSWGDPLLGSGPFDLHNHLIHQVYLDKFRQMKTKTFGRYDGVNPVIVTVDPNILRSVLVKNFDNFNDIFFFINTKKVSIHEQKQQ